ncbi:MAG: hypothetical protein JSV04_10725 [Candidatus Heimdallarchaeota archaeon]|nr:MAG: hypothetical protein JSV04_10725 [Candidatus Heimdallarchaeota archaeon]
MYFPFSLESVKSWLENVPDFLLTLPTDSKYIQNKEFHIYLASTLESFFSHAPPEFLLILHTILTEATEAGKYVLLEVLLHAKSIWSKLNEDETFQPALTELALTSDRLYSNSAKQLSSSLENIPTKSEKLEAELQEEVETVLEDILEGAFEEISKERYEEEEAEPPVDVSKREMLEELREIRDIKKTAKEEVPSPAPPLTPAAISEPLPPPASPPPPSAAAPPSPPAPTPSVVSEAAKKRKKARIVEPSIAPAEPEALKGEVETQFEERLKTDTIHTHVHYYSRMNSHKTYPFTVTLSRIAKKIAADKLDFFSGEREKETRGEFELADISKRLVVEPLLSGCLVQPSSQFVNPRNLPKELTFFITPLVEAGFRSTSLTGSIFVKDEQGEVLLELNLSELSVASHRVAKVAALVGTVGGGAMPAFDLLFGVNLQVTLARQLAYINPQFEQSFDVPMLWIVMGAQVLLFIFAIGIAFLWWWRKGRAKVAPDRAMNLQLTQ